MNRTNDKTAATPATPATDETVKLVDVRADANEELKKLSNILKKAAKAKKNGKLFENATDPSYEVVAREQCRKRIAQAEKSVLRLVYLVKGDVLRKICKDMIVDEISKEILDYDILIEIDKNELNSFKGYLPKKTLKEIRKFLSELKEY